MEHPVEMNKFTKNFTSTTRKEFNFENFCEKS